ncbi:MAG: undecaprenyl diphosphate synthase family protein [Clostridiales bacterium]|nr:undecaprenyl diphosphate synthase family protein [Clostridiales bacterium]
MYRTPTHIGIIPDGNRRWATQNGMDKKDGYEHGLMPGLKLLRAAKELGIKELTYYGFTVDNCKRPKEQVAAFSDACCKAVELIKNEGVEVCVIGNTGSQCFPKELLPYTKRAENSNKMRVNILVNYGWEWDLKNGWQSRDIPRIDLVIRWGGMCRLSGFLPIQTVYSDFYIIKDLWPDFKDEHLSAALDWYSRQDVTLGG